MGIIVILIWLPYLLVRFAPGLYCTARDPFVYAFALLVLAAAFYAFPSSASKSGPTNPPPSAVKGVIRLYCHTPDGRMVPFESPVREVNP
ncbi:MAG TPA: hypothetical protein P5026_07915 [Kiritimatiellia bacterium]|nr:hypothetical protein [Kiritimatiellia bacterium]HRU10246.1 hypothetical protein [Thermoanaerobaculia bacterium]